MSEQPLVSIVVIAFNSQSTILETLNSVKTQSYKNIELIIADDGSKDDTVSIARLWMISNKLGFRVEIVESNINTGVPANCNRAINKCEGHWIKIIAADDILMPNCIEDFVVFCLGNKSVRIVYSDYSCFINDQGKHKIIEHRLDPEFNNKFNDFNREQLYTYLETSNNITPSLFYERSLVHEVGGFNECYKFFEDTPFIVEILKRKIHIFHLEKDTVLYRKDLVSITRTQKTEFFRQAFMDCRLRFRKEKIFPLYRWFCVRFWLKEYSFRFQYRFTIAVLNNKRSRFNILIFYLVKLLNPYYLFNSIKMHL